MLERSSASSKRPRIYDQEMFDSQSSHSSNVTMDNSEIRKDLESLQNGHTHDKDNTYEWALSRW